MMVTKAGRKSRGVLYRSEQSSALQENYWWSYGVCVKGLPERPQCSMKVDSFQEGAAVLSEPGRGTGET